MLIDEIVHTCSNERVAQAAVESLGASFASWVKDAADERGVSVGAFAARIVKDFGEDAQPYERRIVVSAMQKADQPILRGLRAILERELGQGTLSVSWRSASRSASRCECSA